MRNVAIRFAPEEWQPLIRARLIVGLPVSHPTKTLIGANVNKRSLRNYLQHLQTKEGFRLKVKKGEIYLAKVI